jgi:hypothetical protein
MAYVIAFMIFIALIIIVLFYILIALQIIEIVQYLYSKTPHADETTTITGMSDFQIRFSRLWSRKKQYELFKRSLHRKRHRLIVILVIVFQFAKLYEYGGDYYNDEGRYPEAKACYAVGSVANGYSKMIALAGSPDEYWIYPFYQSFEWMKKILYAVGTPHIPSDDAEIALWRYEWFHYPYVIKFHEQLGLGNKRESRESAPVHKAALDDLWNIIETLNTHPFADKNREREAWMDMSTMIEYSNLHAKYNLPYEQWPDVSLALNMTPKYIHRNDQMDQWLTRLGQRYQQSDMKPMIQKAPQVEAIRQSALLLVFEEQMRMKILARTFSCKSDLVRRYTTLRNRYFSGKNPVFLDMRSHGMGKRVNEMIDASQDNISAEFTRQMLGEFCAEKVEGMSPKAKPYAGMDGFYQHLTSEDEVYSNEIKILKEITHE